MFPLAGFDGVVVAASLGGREALAAALITLMAVPGRPAHFGLGAPAAA